MTKYIEEAMKFWNENKDFRVATWTYVTLILTAFGAYVVNMDVSGSVAYWLIPVINFGIKYINTKYLWDLGVD